MTLNAPFCISARLLPAVQVGKAWISIEIDGETSDGRTRYRWYIDTPNFEQTGNDLCSGCQGGSLQDGMASLLSFLSAAAESYRYKGMDGENADLFPQQVTEWAAQHSDELSMLAMELEENPELITH